MPKIPFYKPSVGQEEIAEEIATLKSGWLTTGPKTKQFEREFGDYLKHKHAIAVNSCTAALHLTLEADECHVWSAPLVADAEEFGRLQGLLSLSERERAGRFRCEEDRRAYILSHGILRSLLGRYLGADPDTLCFSTGVKGKPYLTRPSNPFDLRFNLSHSNGLALFAFTLCHEIGVDIECLRGLPDWMSIADRILSPREWAELVTLRPENRLRAFFIGWTRKEAVLKATGEGIAPGMEHIEVSLSPGLPPRVLAILGQMDASSQWTLHHLVPAPDSVAAVAVRRPNISFSYRSWLYDNG